MPRAPPPPPPGGPPPPARVEPPPPPPGGPPPPARGTTGWGFSADATPIGLPGAAPPYDSELFAPTGVCLGRGTFGEAVLLRAASTGHELVCKRMHLSRMQMAEGELAKVQAEVRVLTMLAHEHVIRYVCCFEHEQAVCIAMEYADGGSLADVLAAQRAAARPLATEPVGRWMRQLGSALRHVHSHRVLHRDIKPENIFLAETALTSRLGSSARDVKLGDFGISRVMSSQTKMAESLVGTPCYLSPELVQGEPYNEAADLWALVCNRHVYRRLRRSDGAHPDATTTYPSWCGTTA